MKVQCWDLQHQQRGLTPMLRRGSANKLLKLPAFLLVMLSQHSWTFCQVLNGSTPPVEILPNIAVDAGEVQLFLDNDSDGLPDDWEIAHGLNANDPLDSKQDSDNDGLTNLLEYANGTDPHNRDTDGDGV